MRKASEPAEPRPVHLVARRALLAAILLLSLWVARSFLVPLAWGAVLAVTFWPFHDHVRRRLAGPAWLTPALFSRTGAIGAQVAHQSLLFFVTLLALYSLLRHGAALGAQLTALSARLWGDLGVRITDRLVQATRSTVAGTVLIALGEGCLIGAAYLTADVPRPFLFTILTIAFAMLPFGAWLMFTLAAAVLVAQGSMFAAALLFAFSATVMLIGDNLAQPALIGNAVRLPFLLAFLGTFGGIGAFGLVGLFLGPVIMAMLLLLWQEILDGVEPGPRPGRTTSKRRTRDQA